ncbi:MAG: coenzyme F420-0:L-glutamate ligase [Nitrososphaerota archaeon]|nr:coenzyme F420-0:L-glutamate ligase [Candidatus Bathyarchaeota archaeon]MDW8194299.1 coenzyme F420-0:L-glutamate ligase [Nitrososphaerota archaeon]
MVKYRALAIVTGYWLPGTDYLSEIVAAVEGRVSDGDILVISEKALSIAMGRIIDEDKVKPSLNSRLIAEVWMPIVWGYILGPICRLNSRLIKDLREYPRQLGGRHKQVALQYGGLLQALMFGSEGGIDGSNLPYSYVSLPLEDADALAERIHREILLKLGKQVNVMIVDTDTTFSFRNFYFTYRPRPMRGIHSIGGFLAYVVGRMFRLKRWATPLAVAGCRMSIEEALRVAYFANRVRGYGSGRTVWDMAEAFNVDLTGISWDMLKKVPHKPIVIIRAKTNSGGK